MDKKHLVVDARGLAPDAQDATFKRAKHLAIDRIVDADTYVLITMDHEQMTFDVLVHNETQVHEMIQRFVIAMEQATKGQPN